MRIVTSCILYIVTAIVLVCYGLGWVAPYVSPERVTIPAYFGLGFPALWGATVVMGIVSIVFRRWGLTGTIVLCLAVSYGEWRKTIVVPSAEERGAADDGRRAIKVLTYNVGLFNGKKDLKEFMEFIKEADADVVCLQEFGFYVRAASQSDILKEFDRLYPYRHLWYKNQSSHMNSGLATFSRFPIVRKEKIQYKSNHNVSIFSDMVVDGDTIRVINNHLESNKLDKQDKDLASFLDEKTSRDEIIEHSQRLQSKLGAAMKIRARQAEAIRYTVSRTHHPVIVAGDFNDVPQSYTYRIIATGLEDAYVRAGQAGYYWTYNSSMMYFPIDHIVYSPSMRAVEAEIHKVELSDHYPVTAVIVK